MANTHHRILVVDDEPQIRRFMKVSITAEGYEYLEATTAKEALEQTARYNPSVIVLDLGLPDADGYQVLEQIRSWSKVPVLVLTARDQEAEKVRLLKAGANDYLTKPFGVNELMARLFVLLRDSWYFQSTTEDAILAFQGLSIDRQNHRVSLDGESISLSRKEFMLLNYLASHANKLVTQEQLLREIWGASHQDDTHYLRIFISQLRKKLKDSISDPRFIETEPGVGYRFIGQPIAAQG
ncbi:DNA-binding response regulator [Idiomarina sp. OT37-5b]|uniref:response regulator n=1 Tax=Idiomarina sp. OT37-5b TaxID=2100422 RepID=UPI000CF95AB1|nr:response regulator transcription factor [Idiomarina sp. OT37-5b]AVJ55728.1 DNA-binding response regulator [Idiomarina sp. OT37-5b]